MRLVTFEVAAPLGKVRRLGALTERAGSHVAVDLQITYLAYLAAQSMDPREAQRMAASTLPSSMEQFINGGRGALQSARQALEFAARVPDAALRGPGRHPGVFRMEDIRLLAPLSRPNSLRDFIAFEDHAAAGARRRGDELASVWYERPIYYKGNHRSILGPEAGLQRPSFTNELDFELEIACVLGAGGIDLDDQAAAASIFGFTIMNDWSARDVQRVEMASRLGPAKSKDFATSLGPCILTADETGPHPSLRMTARRGGEVVCEANLGDAHWKFPQMISFVSQGEAVWPGDVYGSGTPFGGCLLDHGGPYLEPGEVIELEVDRIGVLRNRVV